MVKGVEVMRERERESVYTASSSKIFTSTRYSIRFTARMLTYIKNTSRTHQGNIKETSDLWKLNRKSPIGDFKKNSGRIQEEFRKNSRRIQEEFKKNSRIEAGA